MNMKFGFSGKVVAAAMAVALGAAGVLTVSAGASLAATVNATVDFNDGTITSGAIKTYTEDGYQFYDARIVGGPCEVPGSDKCAALNPHEVTVLTRVDGAAFDFTSIWFYLNGKVGDGTNALAIFDTNNILHRYDLTQPTYDHNTGYTVGLDFAGVTSITFESGGICIPKPRQDTCENKGNARFDTAQLTTTTVPVPAAGLMLVAAIGAIGAMRRRKSA